jgi:hypothetical protein
MSHNHMTREIRPEGSGCPACDAYHRSRREGPVATPLPEQTMEGYLRPPGASTKQRSPGDGRRCVTPRES